MNELVCLDLPCAEYLPTLELQHKLLAQVQSAQGGRAYLLLVEHDRPVITLGRRGRREDILASPEQLSAAGVEIHQSTRGGEVTYHGPGQLVVYPILSLRGRNLTLHRYVNNLEQTVIALLKRFGIFANRDDKQIGVWVDGEKIAAIGIAVARWVTYHGLALNVTTDLGCFEWIVPCGLAAGRATSIAKLTSQEVSVAQIKSDLVECFAEEFGFNQDAIRYEQCPDIA